MGYNSILTKEEKDLLKEALSRTKKPSLNYYKPFKNNERETLINIYKKCIYNRINELCVANLMTKIGIVVSIGFSDIIIGDYGAFFEFNKQDLKCQIKPKFNSTPNRNVKYIWHEILDGTKVYQQVNTVEYADYKPGKFYIAVEDLYFNTYGNLIPLSIIKEEYKIIEQENNRIQITIEKEMAEEIIQCLCTRKNIIETGNFYLSKKDIEKVSEEYRKRNNYQIRKLSEEQQKLIDYFDNVIEQLRK